MTNKAAVELGRLGGLATSAKYGKAHYIKLAENMNAKKRTKALATLNISKAPK